jgi:hypothetical protein
MTGHKTDAVFERYNITDNADKRKAQADLAKYRNNTIATQSASG